MPACAGMTWLVDELKLMNSSLLSCVFDVQNARLAMTCLKLKTHSRNRSVSMGRIIMIKN